MATAATIAAKLTLDTRDYDAGLSDAEKKAASFEKKLKKTGKTLTKVGGIMTASLTLPIVAGFKKMVDAASDMEQAAGAVNTVFGQSAYIIEDFGRRSATAVGLAESDFNQLAAVTGSFLQNLGYDADAAAQETLVLTERASDMAAVFNTDVSQALQAIQSGLKGEFNPLEQFGVKINQAAINARALEMGLADATGAIDDNAKAQAALSLVMEQTDRIAGQFASESETFAVKMQVLKAEFKDAAAELGVRLLPLAVDLLDWAIKMIDKFDELNPKQKDFIVILGGVTAALGPLLVAAGSVVNAMSSLVTVVPKVTAAISSMSTAVAASAGPIAVLLAALTGAMLIADRAAKKTKVLRDEILDENKAVIRMDGTYQDYLDSMEDYLKLAGLRITKDGQVVNKMGAVIDSVDVLTEAEFRLQNMVSGTTSDFGVYAMQMSYVKTATYDAAAAMEEAQSSALDMTNNVDSLISMAKEYDDILTDLNENQEEQAKLMKIIEQGGGYLDGVYMSARDAEKALQDLNTESANLEARMTEMANQLVLDMYYATLAIDGFTDEEIQQYFRMADELGIISSEASQLAIDTYMDAQQEIMSNPLEVNVSETSLDQLTAKIKAAVRAASGTSVSVGYSSPVSGRVNVNRNALTRAVGGFDYTTSPTLYEASEYGQGETAVFIPKNKTLWDVASANQIASILPGFREGRGGGDVTNNYNINATIPQDEIVPTLEQMKVMT
jgi:hypothetical protein